MTSLCVTQFFNSVFQLGYSKVVLNLKVSTKGTLLQIWKIFWYLRLDVEIICRRFHIITLLLFGICECELCEMFIYNHSETIEYVKKLAYFLIGFQTSRISNKIIESRSMARVWNTHFIIFSFRARFISRRNFLKATCHSFPRIS